MFMLTLPFRLAASLFIVLFCASKLFRRAVAGVAVSAAIVAFQHEEAANALVTAGADQTGIAATFQALAMMMGG